MWRVCNITVIIGGGWGAGAPPTPLPGLGDLPFGGREGKEIVLVDAPGGSAPGPRGFDSPFAGWVGKRHFSCRQSRGFHPRTPGYFPLAGKVTKGAQKRGTLSIVSPSFETPPATTSSRGLRPLARGATPPCRLEGGLRPKERFFSRHSRCDLRYKQATGLFA